MFVWKLYGIEGFTGRRYVVAPDYAKVEESLEPGEEVVTDCFLADAIPGCEEDELSVVLPCSV